MWTRRLGIHPGLRLNYFGLNRLGQIRFDSLRFDLIYFLIHHDLSRFRDQYHLRFYLGRPGWRGVRLSVEFLDCQNDCDEMMAGYFVFLFVCRHVVRLGFVFENRHLQEAVPKASGRQEQIARSNARSLVSQNDLLRCKMKLRYLLRPLDPFVRFGERRLLVPWEDQN